VVVNPANNVPLLVRRIAKKNANPNREMENKIVELMKTMNRIEVIDAPNIPIMFPFFRNSGCESR
jgi:hypothetical protein